MFPSFRQVLTVTFCACIFCSMDTTDAITMQSKSRPLVWHTQSVEVSCKPDATEANANEIILLKLQREDGEDVATYTLSKGLEYGPHTPRRLEAVGHLEKNVTKCYLRVIINNPNEKDVTTYKCIVDYMDAMGSLKQSTNVSNLILPKNACEDQMKGLRDEMSHINKKMSQLGHNVTEVYKRVVELDSHEYHNEEYINS